MQGLIVSLGEKGAKKTDVNTFDKIVESIEKATIKVKHWDSETNRILTNTAKKQAERQSIMQKWMESWGITMSGVAATVFVGQYIATTFNTLVKFKTEMENKIEALGVKSYKGDRQTLGTSQQEGIEKIIRSVASQSSVTTDEALTYVKNKMGQGYDIQNAIKALIDKRMKYEMDTVSNSINAMTNIIKEVVMSVFDLYSDKAKKYIDELTDYIRKNKTEIVNITKSFIDFGITIVSAFQPIGSAIFSMFTALKEFSNAWPTLTKYIVATGTAMLVLGKIPIFSAMTAGIYNMISGIKLASGELLGKTVATATTTVAGPIIGSAMVGLGAFAGGLFIKAFAATFTLGASIALGLGIDLLMSKLTDKYKPKENAFEQNKDEIVKKQEQIEKINNQLKSLAKEDPYFEYGKKNLNHVVTKMTERRDKLQNDIKNLSQDNKNRPEKAIVYSIIDGDTIGVLINDEFKKVRAAYINAEESMHVDSEKNTLKGNMASLLVKNMMGVGDEITLSGHRNTAGQYIHDRYERLLGEISKGDSNLQTVLIKSGLAKYQEYVDKATGMPSISDKYKNMKVDPEMAKNAEDIMNRAKEVAKILEVDLSPNKLSLGNTRAFLSAYAEEIYKVNSVIEQINTFNDKTPDYIKTPGLAPNSSANLEAIENYVSTIQKLEKIKDQTGKAERERQSYQSLVIGTKQYKYNTAMQEATGVFDKAFKNSKSLEKDSNEGAKHLTELKEAYVKSYAEIISNITEYQIAADAASMRVAEAISQKRMDMLEREMQSFTKFAELEYAMTIKSGSSGDEILNKMKNKFKEHVDESQKYLDEIYANKAKEETAQFYLGMREKVNALLPSDLLNKNLDVSVLKKSFQDAIKSGSIKGFEDFKKIANQFDVSPDLLNAFEQMFATHSKKIENINLEKEKNIQKAQLDTHDKFKELIYKSIALEDQAAERRRSAMQLELTILEKESAIKERQLNKSVTFSTKRIEHMLSDGNFTEAIKVRNQAQESISNFAKDTEGRFNQESIISIDKTTSTDMQNAMASIVSMSDNILRSIQAGELKIQDYLKKNPILLSQDINLGFEITKNKDDVSKLFGNDLIKRLEDAANDDKFNARMEIALNATANEYSKRHNVSMTVAGEIITKDAEKIATENYNSIISLLEKAKANIINENDRKQIASLDNMNWFVDVFNTDDLIDKIAKNFDQVDIRGSFVKKLTDTLKDKIQGIFKNIAQGKDVTPIFNELSDLGISSGNIDSLQTLVDKFKDSVATQKVGLENKINNVMFSKEDRTDTIDAVFAAHFSKLYSKLTDSKNKYQTLITKLEQGKSAANSESMTRIIEDFRAYIENPNKDAQKILNYSLKYLGIEKESLYQLLNEMVEPAKIFDENAIYEQKLERVKNLLQDQTVSYREQRQLLDEIIADQDIIIQQNRSKESVGTANRNKSDLIVMSNNTAKNVLKEGQSVITEMYRELISTGYTSGVDKMNQALRAAGLEELNYAETITKMEYEDKKKKLLDWIKEKADIAKKSGTNFDEKALTEQMVSGLDVIHNKAKEKLQRVEELARPRSSMLDSFKAGLTVTLQEMTDSSTTFATTFKETFTTLFSGIGPAFSSTVTDILKGDFDNIGKSWTNLMENMLNTFLNTLMKMQMEKLATSFITSMGWGGATSYAKHHSGGIVGSEPTSIGYDNPNLWNSAPRFHSGLLPDEYRAILKKGEGVFTEGQMAALGKSASPTVIQQNQAPKISVVVNNNSGTEAKVTQQDVKFNGEEYIVSVWLDSFQRNKYGLRSALGA
jgi:endonuclease YncB( thermonuclease family)